MSELASMKGWMPMSKRRAMTPHASLVWRVESTRCPVRAAFTAMSAVSPSRISPTSTMSGSWRSTDLRMPAKVSPCATLTWHWLTPASSYSTGSSAVTMLTFGLLRSWRHE